MPLNMPALPDDIDATYPDRAPGDAIHQQHHDAIHGAFASINTAGGVATGDDLAGLGGGGSSVTSVNGEIGDVVLDAADVGAVASPDVTSIVVLTQSEYDALTPDPATLYVVSG